MIFIIASVCFQLHVFGTRHGRCADRENREIMVKIVWLDSDAVMEWERPAAAAQDANRRWTRWLRKTFGTHFLPKPFLVEAGRRKPFPASTGKKESNHGLNDKPENPWYPESVVRGKRKRGPRMRTLKTEQHSAKAINREENLP